jgi:hypothetical protein
MFTSTLERYARLAIIGACITTLPTLTAEAQPATSGVQLLGSLRVRGEQWDWFDAGPEGRYGFVGVHVRAGLQQETARIGWRAELAMPALLGLPSDAVLSAPAGQLGLGASYAAANGARESAGLFAKQLWFRVGATPTAEGHSGRIGRFEFSDGGEWRSNDANLSRLRQSRVAQRLIGPFGFTHGQRSFDGASYSWNGRNRQVTLAAMRPTAGVFDTDGGGSLAVDVAYAAFNSAAGSSSAPADLRVFAMYYNDHRGTVPVDSRPAAVRASASRGIAVTTLGAHWIQRRGDFDVLVWAVRQLGQWGGLRHEAGALVAEAGWQATGLPGAPRLRLGTVRGSGDNDPADGRHGTFFQQLPTPRPFALFPFHNMQNIEDDHLSLDWRPSATWTLRGSAHQLRLREGADLWSLGGGAFDRQNFGFAGRPGNGARGLGNALHVGAEWRPSARVQFELFAARASGGAVTAQSYGGVRPARFAYLETSIRY